MAFICALLPWPISASRFVAKSLAQVLHAEADHYAVILSSWRSLEDDKRFIPAIGDATIQIAETLAGLMPSIGALSFEFSSSAFTGPACMQIKAQCELINQSLARLHIRLLLLPPDYRTRFERTTGILNHSSVGDVMVVLSVIEQCLKTGDPMPSRLPTPLVRRCLSNEVTPGSITKNTMRDQSVRGYCVAVSAYLTFLSAIDELVLVVKGVLGEAHHVPEDLAKFE